ncbi:MAG: serine hydrolase, partial [Crocosphaera sp.]|nr:serine hydrolase [Crocosphaera sp.]
MPRRTSRIASPQPKKTARRRVNHNEKPVNIVSQREKNSKIALSRNQNTTQSRKPSPNPSKRSPNLLVRLFLYVLRIAIMG